MTDKQNVLKNVVFAYTKIQQPDFKYGSQVEKEFSVDCIVDKATAKAWNKEFPKQKAKVVENDDFEGIFKFPAPYPDQDEQYVIKLKKPAQYKKDGELHPVPDKYRPRVLMSNGKTLDDVTKDILVGNGSTGAVSYELTAPNDFGVFARLKAIRVDKLIEYKKESKGGVDYSELGEVGSLCDDFSDIPEREMSEAQKNVKKKDKENGNDNFDDDSIPF